MIGKRGENLRQISRQTGAELMRKDGNVYLTSGTEEQRQHVKQLIIELVVSLASCKVTRITESGIQGFVIWNSAQGIRNPSSIDTIRNPSSSDKESGIQVLCSGGSRPSETAGGGGGGEGASKEIFFAPSGLTLF